MKKIKASFASEYNEQTGETTVDINKLARVLSKWGEIPKTLNDTRAMEISILARRYLKMTKMLAGKQ